MSKRGVKKGYEQTKEHIENRAKTHRGLKRSEETKERMRKPHKKFKLSKEVIEKFRKGKNNPFWGRHHTKRTKQIISEKNTGKFIGSKSSRWKEKININGYINIHIPSHPFATKRGYFSEHRFIMEKHIGRYLKPTEIIHHKGIKYPINDIRNKSDNRPKNLRLFKNISKHLRFHRIISSPQHRNRKRTLKTHKIPQTKTYT